MLTCIYIVNKYKSKNEMLKQEGENNRHTYWWSLLRTENLALNKILMNFGENLKMLATQLCAIGVVSMEWLLIKCLFFSKPNPEKMLQNS